MSEKPKTREVNHEGEDLYGVGHCPICHKPVHPRDRICANCGYDPINASKYDDEGGEDDKGGGRDNLGKLHF